MIRVTSFSWWTMTGYKSILLHEQWKWWCKQAMWWSLPDLMALCSACSVISSSFGQTRGTAVCMQAMTESAQITASTGIMTLSLYGAWFCFLSRHSASIQHSEYYKYMLDNNKQNKLYLALFFTLTKCVLIDSWIDAVIKNNYRYFIHSLFRSCSFIFLHQATKFTSQYGSQTFFPYSHQKHLKRNVQKRFLWQDSRTQEDY